MNRYNKHLPGNLYKRRHKVSHMKLNEVQGTLLNHATLFSKSFYVCAVVPRLYATSSFANKTLTRLHDRIYLYIGKKYIKISLLFHCNFTTTGQYYAWLFIERFSCSKQCPKCPKRRANWLNIFTTKHSTFSFYISVTHLNLERFLMATTNHGNLVLA